MRARSTVAAITAAAAALLALGASPASAADDGPFDLYALRSPGFAVDTGSCRYVPFTARTTAGAEVASVAASVDIWNGREHLGSVDLTSDDSGDPTRLSGEYYYCDYEGVGVMRLGDTEVTYYDVDYNSGSFIDTTRGSVDIRQAVRTSFSGKRAGATRSFLARPLYFEAGWSEAWTRFPEGTVLRLQRRAASGKGTWTKVAAAKVDARGRAAFKVSAPRSFQYRVVASGTKHSRALTSRRITL